MTPFKHVNPDEHPTDGTVPVVDDSMQAAGKQPILRLMLGFILTAGLLYWIFFVVMPKHIDFNEVKKTLEGLSPTALIAVFVVSTINTISNIPMIRALAPSMTRWLSFVWTQGSSAIFNTIPVVSAPMAAALRIQIFLKNGMEGEEIGGVLAANGVISGYLRFGLPVVACVLVMLTGEGNQNIFWFAVIGALVLTIVTYLLIRTIASEGFAKATGRWVGRRYVRFKGGDRDERQREFEARAIDFRTSTGLLAQARGVRATVWTLINQLTLFLAFVVSLRVVGVGESDVTIAWAFLAFTGGRLLTVIAPTPGGLGVADAGYIAILSASPGAHGSNFTNDVAAAMVIFRALTYIPPTVYGVFCLLWLRHDNAKQRRLKAAANAAA